MTVANQTTTDLSVGLPAINPNGPPPGIATAFADINVSLQSGADVQTLLVAVVSEPPVSFDTFKQLPRKQNIGTFWSMQNPNWPPMPGDMLGLPVWEISAGRFIMDDRNVDYAALQAAADEEAALTAPAPMMRMSLMSSSLATSYAYNNRPYLSNLTASPASDGSMTMNFSISGGTNFVPYDILMTTNLSTPSDSWNWIGIGYTSNRYSFTSQPGAMALYGLAKPEKTMVVPWGDDFYGQCDIWNGITNAMQVTGGIEFSLALLSDGTMTGWGYDGASPSDLELTNRFGVTMIAAGWQHVVALLTNGTVTAWGDNFYGELNVPAGLSNVVVISAQAVHSLALKTNGTVVAWGYNASGEASVPAGLTNVTAIAAGGEHNLVVSNGYVIAWGYNGYGQTNVPAGLSNVWDVAAGWEHSLALKKDGTVVAWGDNSYGEINVPNGLSNVVAIAAGGDPETDTAYSLALKSDGTVTAWGNGAVLNPMNGLSNVIALGSGAAHALAIRTGPPTPVITLEPTDAYQAQGSNAVFTARGAGLYSVTYQWQTNGVNLPGATNAALTLTNVQAAQLGVSYRVVVGNEIRSIVSSNACLHLVTPPVITSMTLPTNQVAIYLTNLVLNIAATAPGIYNGFPLSYQWQFNGSNIANATGSSYTIHATANSFGTYSVLVSNAAGSTNAAWQVTVYYPGGLAITQQPTNQYQIAGGTINFSGNAVGSNSVTYQWTFNGTNIAGATNASLTLTNVSAAQQGYYNFVASSAGNNVTSSNAYFYLVTPPTIVSQSPTATNLTFGVAYQTNLTLNVAAAALGTNNGFPLVYQWQLNGANIAGANTHSNNINAIAYFSGTYSVIVSNAAGTASATWQVTVTNAINVTNDLLLIYNANSADSSNLCAYYLVHRPMVGGANVLPVACDTGEFTTSTNCNAQIVFPVLNWLTNNPAKRPQYVILFYDIPTRLTDLSIATIPTYYDYGSVGYHLHSLRSDWQPFVNYINGGTLADCKAYVDKVASFGTNCSPGKLIISASVGGYGNTNYVLDGIRHGAGYSGFENYSPFGSVVASATNGLISAGVPTNNILFSDGTETFSNSIAYNLPHPTGVTNVAGYICWGGHSSLGAGYAVDGTVQWKGNSSWWIIRTLESFNGQKADPGQGNFVKWFSSNAFGGTKYSNTPIGASSNVEEPGLEGGTTTSKYFNLWASGKNFGVCVWSSINTHYFQAVGDPFVAK